MFILPVHSGSHDSLGRALYCVWLRLSSSQQSLPGHAGIFNTLAEKSKGRSMMMRTFRWLTVLHFVFLFILISGKSLAAAKDEAVSGASPALFQFSVYNPTQLITENRDITGLRLTLVFGKNADVSGLDMALGFTLANNVSGLQLAVIGNESKSVSGIQISGIGNGAKSLSGIQISGIMNAVGSGSGDNSGDGTGIQVGGLLNVVGGEFHGVQIGAFNKVGTFYGKGNVTGVQVAIANSARSLAGAQVGLWNGANECTGAQLSLFINTCYGMGRSLTGIQIGLMNNAVNCTGLQIGLVNLCNDMYGVQIGLINRIAQGRVPYLPIVNAKF